MPRAQGRPVDPFQGFKFLVQIRDFQEIGFRSITGLREETEVVEYREGDNPVTMTKVPGLTSYDNVVLERGMSPNDDLIRWRRQMVEIENSGSVSRDGLPSNEFRRPVTVTLYDKGGGAVKEWELLDAWPTVLEIETLDATTSDILIERLELAHEGLVQVTPAQAAVQIARDVTQIFT